MQGEAETNVHAGGNGGDTVTNMPDEDYKKFCRKVGDATRQRCQSAEYRARLAKSIAEAMQRPEIKKKVSDRTKAAMQTENVKERMWRHGRASPVLLVYPTGTYKLFK